MLSRKGEGGSVQVCLLRFCKTGNNWFGKAILFLLASNCQCGNLIAIAIVMVK